MEFESAEHQSETTPIDGGRAKRTGNIKITDACSGEHSAQHQDGRIARAMCDVCKCIWGGKLATALGEVPAWKKC